MITEITMTNMETGQKLELGTEDSPFLIDEIDWDSPEVSRETYRVPKQIGETLTGVTVGTRKPTVTGYIIADIEQESKLGMKWEDYYKEQEKSIEELKMKLDKLINVNQDILLETNGYFLNMRPIHSPKYSIDAIENNEVLCKFVLSFECYKPLFYKSEKEYIMAGINSLFKFPLVIPASGIAMGSMIKKQTQDVVNDGQSPTGIIVTLKAIGGVVKNPIVRNVSTGEYFGLDGITLEDGDYVIINTETGEESVIKHSISQAKDMSVVGNITTGSKFLQLKQGTFLFIYDVDDEYKNNLKMSIRFTEKYYNIRGM